MKSKKYNGIKVGGTKWKTASQFNTQSVIVFTLVFSFPQVIGPNGPWHKACLTCIVSRRRRRKGDIENNLDFGLFVIYHYVFLYN